MTDQIADTGGVAQLAAPPTDAAGAQSRKAELMADPGFRDRYLGGNAEARAEMGALNAVIAAAAAADGTTVADHFEVEYARAMGVSDGAIEQFRTRLAVTPQERELVQQWKTQHMNDKAWVEKFLAGDIQARREMTTATFVSQRRSTAASIWPRTSPVIRRRTIKRHSIG